MNCNKRGPMKAKSGNSSSTGARSYKSTPAKSTGGGKTKGGKAAYNAPIKPSKSM